MTTNLPRPSQAQSMIMRVSPEGRARAQKERERQQRATNRVVGWIAVAALVVTLLAWLIDAKVFALGTAGVGGAIVAFLVACAVIVMIARDRPASAADITRSPLDQLPAGVEAWLDRQRPSLPAPAVVLLDSLSVRLGDLAPQLATLDANGPAAESVRRLLATDLPALVKGYQDVPTSLRARAGDNGQSADAHLLHGLGVVDGEIGRMTEQLARGAFDELATQHRFLELKYEGAGGLG